jgi:hypothetical protein
VNIDLMSRRRHTDLIKAAEITVSGMNDGLHPNAALMKAAQELDLNAKEVALVSHAVNNSATVSHLANTEGKDKAGPFVLTNADEVTQQLFPQQEEEEAHNQTEPGKRPEGKTLESPLNLDPLVQKKKLAAALDSYSDTGFYGAPEINHAKVAREAFALERGPLVGRQIVSIGLNRFEHTADFAKSAAEIRDALDQSCVVDCSRLPQNPYLQLRNIKVAVEHARGQYVEARDAAFGALSKLAEAFRRTDAPAFARIELLAKHAGCGQDTLDAVYTMAALAPIGHKRAGAMKLAAHVQVPCSPRENTLIQHCLLTETMWKRAADCLAAQHDAETWLKTASAAVHDLVKRSDESNFLGEHIKGTSSNIADFPNWAVGKTDGSPDTDFVGKVTGDWKEDADVKHPLNLASRQRLGNASGATNFNSLFDDEFIAGQPIPDVVKAYNKVIAAKPDIDATTVAALVKEQLARGGGIDSDTLIRLKKDYRSKE